MLTRIKTEFVNQISKLTNQEVSFVNSLIQTPPNVSLGVFSFPCFQLSKILKQSPNIIAESISKQISIPDCVCSNVGPYINLKLPQGMLSKIACETSNNPISNIGENKKVVIDYSSPNAGKELLYHHIRSTAIGLSLSKIYKECGWDVTTINHLGDWGTQFGKLIYMWFQENNQSETDALANLKNLTILDLNRMYIQFGKLAEENPSLEDSARYWFSQLEQNDHFSKKCWERMVSVSKESLKEIYSELGVEFDHILGESFYIDKIEQTISKLNEKNLLEVSEGAQIVNLESGPCLIKKADGSSLYSTRDIAAALYRYETFGFDKCLYVVDAGQSFHFSQCFDVLGKIEKNLIGRCVHVPFGLVLGKSETGTWKKISSRMGVGNSLMSVVDQATEKIQEKASGRNIDKGVARTLAIDCLKFSELKNKRIGDTKFDLDEIVSFEGETGAYIQYAHARISSIISKHVENEEPIRWELLKEDEAETLAHKLTQFKKIVESSCEENEPSILAIYLIDVSNSIHSFVHNCRVLGTDEENERIALLKKSKFVLNQGMKLLGMNPVERM